MSRAVNLSLSEDEVRRLCERRGIAISATEPLPSGGTRLICVLPEGTEAARLHAKGSVLGDRVARFRFYDPHGRSLRA
jgi:hypothetical protein